MIFGVQAHKLGIGDGGRYAASLLEGVVTTMPKLCGPINDARICFWPVSPKSMRTMECGTPSCRKYICHSPRKLASAEPVLVVEDNPEGRNQRDPRTPGIQIRRRC